MEEEKKKQNFPKADLFMGKLRCFFMAWSMEPIKPVRLHALLGLSDLGYVEPLCRPAQRSATNPSIKFGLPPTFNRLFAAIHFLA